MQIIRLQPSEYGPSLVALESVKINKLFAHVVLDGTVAGTVLVDNAERPGCIYVAHPYGMSLLYGEPSGEFLAALEHRLLNVEGTRASYEAMQVYPRTWEPLLEDLLGARLLPGALAAWKEPGMANLPGRVVQYTRVNFDFDADRFRAVLPALPPCPLPIAPVTAAHYDTVGGTVVPRPFWRSARQFLDHGAGYVALDGERVASIAFSAMCKGGELEIGIETMMGYRGRGLAQHVAAALIGHCLGHGLEPVWSCRLENNASYRLAQKLGFVPTCELPFYSLPWS